MKTKNSPSLPVAQFSSRRIARRKVAGSGAAWLGRSGLAALRLSIAALLVITAANAHGQVAVNTSGGAGANGSNLPVQGTDGDPGGNGTVANANNALTITIGGIAISGISNGGSGGRGGDGYGITVPIPLPPFILPLPGFGGDGGKGGDGGAVNVTNSGNLTTTSASAHGILAESLAANGGNGGDVTLILGLFGQGGDGGQGGTGGAVTVVNGGIIQTGGGSAQGIFAQSRGGIGGKGGSVDGVGAVGVGGDGAGTGPGGAVSVTNTGMITTGGIGANGIFAQSVGGFAGGGGGAVGLFAFGASSQSAGDGSTVTVTNSAQITTGNSAAFGIFAQSVGGGGGAGGSSGGVLSLGGSGSAGGDGKLVTVNNNAGGNITTTGARSTAIFAQSVGGGGGDGGNSVAVGAFIAVAVGGSGGTGGAGGDVTVNAASLPGTTIMTSGVKSHGINAQSIGGGGGNGGFAIAGSVGLGFSASVGVGGSGGNGGGSGKVKVDFNGSITTTQAGSKGIYAQSVGGGGGDGGFSIAVAGSDTAAVTVGVGGSGGLGGSAGIVEVTTRASIHTGGDGSHAIDAQSVGGGGGDGGFSVSVAVGGTFAGAFGLGGAAGVGGLGKAVTVDSNGAIGTGGNFANGINAQSIGGGGGDGGFTVAGALTTGPVGISLAIGGKGGSGKTSDLVTVRSAGTIDTTGVSSSGIFAQSVGGGGGSGGFAASLAASSGGAIAAALGGSGAGGSDGAAVDVTSSSNITTIGAFSAGIFAQSLGGGGGSGGSSLSGAGGRFAGTLAIGGSGGMGGAGKTVTLNNTGTITTGGILAYGLQAQSIGGGGGNGGFAIGIGVSGGSNTGAALGLTLGGGGGPGSTGGLVNLTNQGSITTSGVGAHAVVAQSIGGGGGSGGFAGSLTGSFGPGAAVSVAIGGSGGTGGTASKVTVNSLAGIIETKNVGANGIHAQSLGGGGGDGGFGLAAALGTGDKSLNLSVAVGGTGGDGGTGGAVEVSNASKIITGGNQTSGIFAQSIGGGGGTGGFAASLTASTGPDAKQISVAVGGSGGPGNHAGDVTITNSNDITANGLQNARGITAQSLGGGGGNGGLSFAGSLSGKDSKQLAVSVGGSGLGGGDGGVVKVTNNVGTISTAGLKSYGILAQSVGGGGGTGGMAISGMLGTGGEGTNVNLAATVGGKGGVGGIGKLVEVTNNDTIKTTGLESSGIYAQSIGGGGGSGGSVFTGVVGVSAAAPMDNKSRTVNLSVSVGGGGGNGNNGGEVHIINSGTITTELAASHGIFVQSIGGGGGDGGRANTVSVIVGKKPLENAPDTKSRNVNLSATIGGNGGGASNGGIVTIENTGVIETKGDNAMGIFAQSVGGGGGTSGSGIIGTGELLPVPVELVFTAVSRVGFFKDIQVAVGGDAGSSGDGKTVTVTNSKNITTHGHDSHGILAQSIGGGGGIGGTSVIGATGKLGLGGKGGAAGNGGDVNVTTTGGIIETFQASSYGIFAQSVGGGGGVAGNVDRALPAEHNVGSVTIPKLNMGIGIALGQGGGNGGNGGTVTVNGTGNIITHGLGAHGIFAQSVGGGGGILGTLGNELLTALDFTDTDTGNNIARLGGFIGSMGDAGSGGQVLVQHIGNITTSGEAAHAIFAQSAGGKGAGQFVHVTVDGQVLAGGADSYGILAQSMGLGGKGDIRIDISGGLVEGGSATGAGVRFEDGANNLLANHGTVRSVAGIHGTAVFGTTGNDAIDNFGAMTGNVNLGSGANAFNNKAGGLLQSGDFVKLGIGNVFTNAGTISPGGVGTIQTTALTGDFVQNGNAIWKFDLATNFTSDRFDISGAANPGAFTNTVDLNELGIANTPGTYTLVTAASGLTGDFRFGSFTGGTLPIGLTYALVNSPTQELLTLSLSTGPFYWRGAADNAWNGAFVNGEANWTSDAAGNNFIFGTPGAASDVIFSSTNAATTNRTTVLGADFTIHTLTMQDPNAVTIGGANSLTISGNAGTGVDVQNGAGLFSIATHLTLAGASDTITVNNAAGAQISGIVSGSNGLIKEGTGTLSLSGVNDYTSTTTVNGGTLLAGSTQAFGVNSAMTVNANATLDLGANDTTIGSLAGGGAASFVQSSGGAATLTSGTLNTSTTYSGVLQDGTGTLAFVKEGTGTQTLAGASTYTGGTTLNDGTLAAADSKAFGSGDFTMTGGTVRTTGGPLTVDIGAGDILFSGGRFQANVGGTLPGTQYDRIVTTGKADTARGTFALVQQNNYRLAPGDKVALLAAAGGVAGGTDDGVAVDAAHVTGLAAFSNTPLLIPTVNVYTKTVVLEAMQGSFLSLTGTLGFTPNQHSVAGALDSLTAITKRKTGIFIELNFLDTQPLSTLAGNLDKIAPDELTSIFNIAVSLANVQSANVERRLEEVRADGNAGIPASGAVPGGGSSGPVGNRSKGIAPAPEERWGMWFAGSGEFTRVGSTTNAAGFSLESGGVTAGIDYRFTDHFVAGISIGYANTTASLVNGGKVDVDGGRVGAYATYFTGGLHLDAAVSGGPNSYKTRRITPNNTIATGGPEGTEVNLLFAAGYDWKSGALTIGPVASFQYTNVQLDGFTERGVFAPLSVVRRNEESIRSALGFHATYDMKVGRAIIRPEVRAVWQHEFGDTTYSLTSTFATLGGAPFTARGPTTGRDSLLVGAGIGILWNDRFSTYVNYDGELLRTNYSSHNISAGFRIKF